MVIGDKTECFAHRGKIAVDNIALTVIINAVAFKLFFKLINAVAVKRTKLRDRISLFVIKGYKYHTARVRYANLAYLQILRHGGRHPNAHFFAVNPVDGIRLIAYGRQYSVNKINFFCFVVGISGVRGLLNSINIRVISKGINENIFICGEFGKRFIRSVV